MNKVNAIVIGKYFSNQKIINPLKITLVPFVENGNEKGEW